MPAKKLEDQSKYDAYDMDDDGNGSHALNYAKVCLGQSYCHLYDRL